MSQISRPSVFFIPVEETDKTVETILNFDSKPVRITIGVGYLIGARTLLEKKLDKLPKTKA